MKNLKNLITNAALSYLGLDPEFIFILDYIVIVFISLKMNIVHFINIRKLFVLDSYLAVEKFKQFHFVTYVTPIILLFKLSLNHLITMHECCKN